MFSPTLSTVEVARGARASGFEWNAGRAQPADSAQPPAAAGEPSPAVVNHVRGADPSARSDNAGQRGAPGQAGAESDDEAHAEEIRQLAKRDAEVRAHEQAHAAAGGAHAGSPSYEYQRGPDGRSYAVGGEVPIDVSTVSGDPEATIQKMLQVKRAALAPRDPSDADRAIAATADALIMAARRELMDTKKTGAEGSEPHGDIAREAFGALERRNAAAAAYGPAQSRANSA